MLITTQIDVAGDTYPYTAEQAAAQVLAALGGSTSAGDTSTATITFHKLRISTSVTLQDDDNMAYTAEAAADQVLAALAGNPTTDHAAVLMVMPGVQGEAGVPA